MASELNFGETYGRLGTLLSGRTVRELLTAFTDATDLPITLRDGEGRFIGSPTRTPRWCFLLRRSRLGSEECRKAALLNIPSAPGKVVDYTCHECLQHLAAGVFVGGRLMAQVIVGPYVEEPIGEEVAVREARLQRASRAPSLDELLASRREVKWLPRRQSQTPRRLLLAVTGTIAQLATQLEEQERLAAEVALLRHHEAAQANELAASPEILVVDPDASRRQALADSLEEEGLPVRCAANSTEALGALDRKLPSVVLIEEELDHTSGAQLCCQIRRAVELPIVILGAKKNERRMIDALERCAEDYLIKPIGARELAARLRRIARGSQLKSAPTEPAPRLDGELAIHVGQRAASVDGQIVKLTPKECRILASLAQRTNQPVPVEVLINETWPEGDGDPTQLWVHIRNLRRKLEADPSAPRHILTRRGAGYVLASGRGGE